MDETMTNKYENKQEKIYKVRNQKKLKTSFSTSFVTYTIKKRKLVKKMCDRVNRLLKLVNTGRR